MGTMIGKSISHYKIIEKLGAGGMGVVYKAHDTKLERAVAIKFLTRQIATNPDQRERFKIEAKASAALNHPNIATIYAIEEMDDELFIVMEYIEGQELVNLTKPLRFSKAIDIATQIAEGLQAAHKKGIFHRDIKSSNVMVTESGPVKVMDFGLAKVAGGAQLTRDQSMLGTAAYMSPEQARGEVADHRSDIWSFGVVLYEMLTGQLPFKGDYEQAVIYSILNEEPESITKLNDELPKALESIINKTLAKTPDERYQSTGELIRDLRDLQDSENLHIEKPHRKRHKQLTKRPKWLIGASVFLVLLAIIWGWLRFASEPPDTTTPTSRTAIAVLPFSVRGASQFDYLGEGMVNLLSTKLDGAGELRSVDPRALLSFVSREMPGVLGPEDGRKVAQRFGAGLFVMGDIVEAGGQLQINAALYEADQRMKVLGESIVEGEAEQIFGVVDKLATQLLTTLTGESGTRVTRLAAVTTSSLPALKTYLEGENALRKADFESAVTAFQRAVVIDTLFALAYYRLSVAAEWLIDPKLAHDAAQLAFRYAGRLSERDRRLLEALLAYRQGRNKKAEELYRSLLGTHPDDVEAWIQLGEVLFHYNPLHGRSFAEAREPFERVLFYEPQHTASFIHLARIAAAERKYSELDSLVQTYVNLYPSGGRVLSMLTLQAFSQDSPMQQQHLMNRLKEARDEDVALAVWNVGLYIEDLQAAERLMRVLAESPRFSSEVQAVARAWLAHLMLAKGQLRLAKQQLSVLEQLDFVAAKEYWAILASLPFVPVERHELVTVREALTRLRPKDFPEIENPSAFFSANNGLHPLLKTYLAGLLSSRLGELQQAAQYAKQIEQITTPSGAGSLASDLALSVQAHIDLQNGRREEALAKLEQTRRQTWYELMLSSSFYSQAYERFMRAELLLELGQAREALGWYSYLATTSPFEVVYVPISYLRRGEIYEKLGDHEKAIAHYTRFVYLWQDCDVELRPMLEKAKKKIAEIKNLARK
ncbi:protein kinase [candidate division KSB1 bacterium]|nr:protein kinase [candidate division KSB1 bacterium]NIT75258.1 protein kinase [candidate division KSB1 bacterium]NIX74938.1 protein kinase [candidate division KSB1 bacterium]